jgi:RNA polymerase sigma-70 factor (ECF subfamily)
MAAGFDYNRGQGVVERRSHRRMVDWDLIVSREGPAVWRTLYRLLGDRADAEDCFQETFLGALSVWKRQAVQHPRAMLNRLATARALDRLRQRYRQNARRGARVEPDEVCSGAAMPEQLAEASELSERLRKAISTLPEKQAQAFCLYYLEGWDYQQIAGHQGGTVNAVGVLLHRARHRLRELLGEVVGHEARTV